MNFIIFGPQGSGKGTLATAFSRMNLETCEGRRIGNMPVISTGDLLREEIKKGSPLGLKVKPILEGGKLVSDEDVLALLKARLQQQDAKERGFILDGFPRTMSQAELLEKNGIKIDAAVLLDVKNEVLISRLSTRRVCGKCGAVYNTVSNKPKVEGLCDKDGTALTIRDDDKPEAIKQRLATFEEKTRPLAKYYEEKGMLRTVSIDTPNAAPEENAMKIVAALGLRVTK